ncbi:ROK family protein [Agromyces subbeticus]|uniref:ROK family protein n=1 Tax=Agromyces subbeticus TaxID=293890 RepID=UPI0003B66AE9|nr:ROK family protein [Agromyces subbeticus]
MTQLTIDLGGTAVKLGVFDANRLLDSAELAAADGRLVLDEVAAAADRMLRGARADGIAIAVPGIVDPESRRLVAAHGKYAALHGVDLAEWSHARFGVPAVVENDARAALIGEMSAGSAHGARDAVLIALGTGIGTAAAIDGRIIRGAHGHAGVLSGHVTVDLDGPRCPCGNLGCAEALASTWALGEAIARRAVSIGPELARRLGAERAIGIRDLVETRNEPESAAVLERYVRVWGAVVVGQCHAFDPTVVVVTGGVMRSRDVVLPALVEYVHEHLWSSSFRPAFVTPEAPALSVLRGLAALALDSATARDTHGPR